MLPNEPFMENLNFLIKDNRLNALNIRDRITDFCERCYQNGLKHEKICLQGFRLAHV